MLQVLSEVHRDEVSHGLSFSWRPEGLDRAVTIDVAALFEGILGDD